MVMSRYSDLWSGPGTQTFDFSNRLRDQAATRLQDLVEREESLYLFPEALDQPTSWSRAQDRPVSLRELIAAHYPATARRFSVEPPRPEDASALRVTQLSDQEFLKVTSARLDHGIHDFKHLPGVVFASYPIQLLKHELGFETTEGAQMVDLVAQRLALLETRLAADRVHVAKSQDLHDAGDGGS
jgi:hypothetical protein